MKKHNLKISLILLAITFIYLLFPHNAAAADYGFAISPPLLRIFIKPGKSITQVFKIENLSTNSKTLVASVVPFTEADNFGNPILNPKANSPWLSYFSLANSTIKLDQPFILPAGKSEQLIVSLTVPDSAPLRDIYATLVVSTYTNEIKKDFQGTSVNATIGSNMLITISSQTFPNTTLIVEDFLPEKGTYLKIGNLYFIDSLTPVKVSANVRNEGNFAAETKGVFRVTTKGGQPVFLNGILPANVIAKSTRQLRSVDGEDFEFTPSLGQIGVHKFSLEIKTENSNTTGTIEIFFFPLKLTLAVLLSIIIISSVAKYSQKSPKSSSEDK